MNCSNKDSIVSGSFLPLLLDGFSVSDWFQKKWSHPPGLNRRPADYETIQSAQIAENAVYRPSFAPATEPVVAQVEQVSEQVEAHVLLPSNDRARIHHLLIRSRPGSALQSEQILIHQIVRR
jgi:hypothetical protein